MYVDMFEGEINDELLNKICQYNVSNREVQTIFPQAEEIPQFLSLKGSDQLLTNKGTKLKRDSNTRVSCKYCEIFKTTFFNRAPPGDCF